MKNGSNVSFIPAGGANSIGLSAYVLKLGDYAIGIDWGAGYGEPGETPKYEGGIDCLLLSHGHLDHVGMVPYLKKIQSVLPVWATRPTRELANINWHQSIKLHGEECPFGESDISRAFESMNLFLSDEPFSPLPGVTVTPYRAGHILGAVSFLIEYRGDKFFFSNDICFHDRRLVRGAKIPELDGCRLLVRESTYINRTIGDRQKIKQEMIAAAFEVLKRGGRLLIPALTIDRTQDIFAELCSAGFAPLFVDGGANTVNRIYRKYIGEEADILANAYRFKSDNPGRGRPNPGHCFRGEFLDAGKPGIIIASSGMLFEDTLSHMWASRVLPNENDAIFLVNYQVSGSPGHELRNSRHGDFITWGEEIIKINCEVREFNCSAHMDGPEGEALERRLKPETIVYAHGEDTEIEKYLQNHNDGQRRLKAQVGQEVQV